ncbi:MAG TPA: cytochrome c [Rhodocyclaceae bacterium]
MKAAALALACLAAAGCERAMHNMYDQPRYKAYAGSPLFADGSSARTPPPGTLAAARGPFAGTTSGRLGGEDADRDEAALAAPAMPYPVTRELLARGQERFGIYCVPCHSPAGDGDGLVARRGFPHPPSYHIDRLRNAPDRHLFEVIGGGYGVMPSYGDVVAPPDRWAIVAYIRALQLSQWARADALPGDARQRLQHEAPP